MNENNDPDDIQYIDVFLKDERFIFVCTKCYAAVVPGYHPDHSNWHKERGE